MKRILSMLLVLLMLLSTAVAAGVTVIAADHEVEASPKEETVNGPSVYDAADGPDYSWYLDGGSNPMEGEIIDGVETYTLTSANQFVAFANVTNGVGVDTADTFAGKAVVLACDVIINVGDADAWWADTEFVGDVATSCTDLVQWEPIGARYDSTGTNKGYYFGGTFDGQGHYISGVYCVRKRSNGLFGMLTGATVKNFALVNSVFYGCGALDNAKPGASNQMCGSVSARMKNSLIDTVYSDSYVYSGYGAGGIIGYMESGDNTVSNAIYTGVVDGSTAHNYYVGGFIGVAQGNKATFVNCAALGTLEMGMNKRTGQTNPAGNLSGHGGFGQLDVTTYAVENCIVSTEIVVKDGRSISRYSAFGYLFKLNGTMKNVYVDMDKSLVAKRFEDRDTYHTEDCLGKTTAEMLALNVAWEGWTTPVGEVPVPTAAWNLAERTFDDVALSFVQETDVSTIDKGDSLYTG